MTISAGRRADDGAGGGRSSGRRPATLMHAAAMRAVLVGFWLLALARRRAGACRPGRGGAGRRRAPRPGCRPSFGCGSASRCRRSRSACSTPRAAEVPQVAVEPQRRHARRSDRPRRCRAGAYLLSYRVTSLDAHAVGATLRFGVGRRRLRPAWPGTAPTPASAWAAAGSTLAALPHGSGRRGARPRSTWWSGRHHTCERAWHDWLVAGWRSPACRPCCCAWAWPGSISAVCRLPRFCPREPWLVAATSSLGGASALAALGLAGIALERAPAVVGRRSWPRCSRPFLRADRPCRRRPAALADRPGARPARAVRAFWLGSLLPLLVEPAAGVAESDPVLRRFSAAAPWPSALLVCAGSALAWIQLGGTPAR